ncbi:hypothetical protein [Filibacter tadaridae]|uniref:Uncharacterized protein n=1 Tax=Filibacter tadaridae TaxID=2483811 RepID=A0A3P5WGZ9_9BACL|nr:hypothetical protein [Filibacter tadaridae]VDC19982.1 hypothetical protein FILTAD_00418 [Filibacter tadaridae]
MLVALLYGMHRKKVSFPKQVGEALNKVGYALKQAVAALNEAGYALKKMPPRSMKWDTRSNKLS